MNTIATARVIGARHLRTARNGQDAVAGWSGDAAAVVAVADGCSSGECSEVGAALGAQLFVRAVATRLATGASPADEAMWSAARGDVVRALAELLERMPGDRSEIVHAQFLFTIVAAAATRDGAAVWALGDGAYTFGDRTCVLGPFDDNAPPYLAYDLFGDRRDADVAVAPDTCATIVIATDGASELVLEDFAAPRFVEHPDALRRRLAVLARPHERIDWDEQRVLRTPALLQDDCAIGVLHRRRS